MSRSSPLGKRELNERFYSAVDPEAAFVTEVQVGFHQVAVARLVARHAAGLGKERLRILELGASACLFAIAFVEVFSRLVLLGDATVEALDYTAVEYSRAALESALRTAVEHGFDAIADAAAPAGALAAAGALPRLRRPGAADAELALVQAEANRFVSEGDGAFDVVILNELLDDLPYRVVYADAEGGKHELVPYAYPEGAGWRVRLSETDAAAGEVPEGMPAGTLFATSDESTQLVSGIVDLLEPGGVLLIHDYGFTERFAGTEQYGEPQRELPSFVELEYPPTPGAPKSFFRVYGNEASRAVQITNDVNFAELAELLEPTGMVLTLPHGNMLSTIRTYPDLFFKGDGVFVSEFINLTADDDLDALLAELYERQAELRDHYVETFGGGRSAVFSDLIYVKA
jgi:SAM-dependent MidA family methyltransferase